MTTNDRTQQTACAACPACSISGYCADECRATRYPDGNIVCYNCGSIIPPVDDNALKVLRGLPTSVKYSTAVVLRGRADDAHGLSLKLHTTGFGERDATSMTIASHSLNMEAVAANDARVRVVFGGRDRLGDLAFIYDNRHTGAHTERRYQMLLRSTYRQTSADPVAAALEAELVKALCPRDLAAAVGRLVVSGYAVKSKNIDALMRRVVLSFEPDAPAPVVDGEAPPAPAPTITVECTWYI